MFEIKDINDERIKEFISLKQSSLDEKYVVVESKNVFKKLFSKNIKIHKVFTSLENCDFINENCKNIDFEIFTSSNEIMKKIVGHKIHQGLLALISRPQYINFDDIKGNVVVLNSLTSPENVGSIVRTCASFNIKNIIIDEKTCSPFIRRCIRVSTGNIFNINVYKSKNLKEDLEILQKNNYKIISTANTKEAKSLNTFTFPPKSAIIIGNEGYGVSKDILAMSDDVLKIDISEEVTSLNAAIASSIVLYEMSKNKTS